MIIAQHLINKLTCSQPLEIVNGVIDLLPDKEAKTSLEKINYDAVGGITEKSIDTIGRAWSTVFDNAGMTRIGEVLEIGSGTGALTVGLLKNATAVVATDISQQFLEIMLARAQPANVLAVRCDCNTLPVHDTCFDLVVGRSILHHLLDYEQVLTQAARVLRPGGKAIFFEPILEGKLVLGLLAETVVNTIRKVGDSSFSNSGPQ